MSDGELNFFRSKMFKIYLHLSVLADKKAIWISGGAQELPGFRLTGEIAEKRSGSFRSMSQILSHQQRSKTRVNIKSAFPLWFNLKDRKRLKSHAEVVPF